MRRRAHNLHVKRQGPILSGILGGGGVTILPTLSGPLGSITSILPIPLPSLSLPGPVTTTTTDLPSSPSLSSSTAVSIESSTSSTLSSSTISSASETSATPTPTVTPTVIQSVFETTSGGTVHTVTTVVNSAPSATRSLVPPPAPKSFLQNKVLSGIVFALVGIVGLVIILAIATFVIRRKRNNRLMKDAISFDPTSTTDNHHYGVGEDRGSFEKRSVLARSSNDHPSASGNAEQGGYSMSGARAYGQGPSYGRDLNLNPMDGYPYPYPNPPPALVHEYAHGPNRALPVFPQSEGINWGPSLTPFTAPSGSPDPEYVQSQGRPLKVRRPSYSLPPNMSFNESQVINN